MKENQITLIIAVTLLAVRPAIGRMLSTIPCDQMLTKADIVVKGEALFGKIIEDASSVGNGQMKLVQVRLRIDRAIKGEMKEREADIYFYAGGTVDLAPNQEAVLFLKKTSKGLYVLDVDNGIVVLDKTQIADTNAGTSATGDLRAEFAASAKSPDSHIARASLNCLIQLRGESLPNQLRQLKASDKVVVRAKAVANLVEQGDQDSAVEMVKILNTAPMRQGNNYSADDKQIQTDFVNALWQLARAPQPALLPQIVQLLHHKDQYIKKAALHALRAIKSPAAVPELTKLLDESDNETQYLGVVTLCEIAKKKNCPSMVLFEKEHDKHIAEWKAWSKEDQEKHKESNRDE